ncbi:SpoIIE family protein phosphatase [Actinospica robiniae]|uniref:histidine kinase n=1 Tax=Actinospica robiniae DSM 44927 TaxID=479430 RepID=W9DWC2_9ACTN|nr:SpoIIE family protein phosphatase [Actinospica robiniae]ETA71124.1 PAS domain S-box [Actinospica robiniae DSM 44927]
MTTPEDVTRRAPVDAVPGVFAADEEVGRDLAAVDWAATPLGPVGTWPQSLQTAVDILLSSRFAMWMAWGPEMTFFCNAAYRRDTLGRKYPWALGRPASEVWSEIWQDIGPRIDTVLRTGKATWDQALLLLVERSGYLEESYHTFSYSPLRDDHGAVVGMLCVVSEETERVIGERQMATLRDLGSDPSVVRTEAQMLEFADLQLARNGRDLPFTATYLFEQNSEVARLAGATGLAAGHRLARSVITPEDADPLWPLEALARGESVLVDLEPTASKDLPRGAWPEPPVQALAVPLAAQGGSPYGFFVAALNRYRLLDERYRGFVELAAGHLASGIGSARSYQAQQRRAEELAELDRAKTAFFSNVSHEFRTPLTLIMGPVEELRDQLADADPRVREELEVVRRNGLRLGKLVNTLLDFSRIEAGRMQARYEPVDLAAVTAELASVFRSAVDKAGLRLEVDCEPAARPVYLDRGMWEKVILNLLSNALKFTFDGSIRVGVRTESDRAVVTVSDTGIGVPETEMPRLFERFHRIENARSRSNEGSGIGLALVKELVQLHGGSIGAESRTGQGTCFTIRLPFGHDHLPGEALAPASDASAASLSAEPFVQEALRWLPHETEHALPEMVDLTANGEAASAGVRAARVLIADDNADMREYLVRLLGTAGYRVSAVEDGREALDAARAEAPDLVVSDVMMPNLDGLELVRRLRSDSRTVAVPVLLLSARAGQESSIRGLHAGADDYLFKPFAAAELLARVRANIELARLRNHHARYRNALIESLQEAFFVCDEDGAVIEINNAFTDIIGYGPDLLPYLPQHPWWPDADTDPQAHRQVAEAFSMLIGRERGTFTVPLVHRTGHRVWITVTFSQVYDPDTGRRVIVGTFRDVTAEHYAIQRESAMAALTVRLSESDSVPSALGDALEELRDLWNAAHVIAAVFDGADQPATASTDGTASWPELPEPRRRALSALRDGPLLTPAAERTGAGVALEHPAGLLTLWIDLGARRPFTDQDQLLLSLLASRLGQQLNRIHQADQQRETALALQRAILGPAHLPDGFAVRYEPAARPLKIGGDWYDTVTLADGRIGIVVGDCVGRGLEAATVMGQLRSACRALLLQEAGPAHVLAALDRFAALIPGAMCTTVFCGVLDPANGQLTYSSAGHPPGIVVDPDGSTHFLDQAGSIPLAVRVGAERPEAQTTVSPRATVLLYTDGLVERRRQSLTVGIDRASAAIQQGRATPVDQLATDVMTDLAPADGYDDDVALLIYRHPAPLEMSFPADSAQLAPVRQTLRAWLGQCGLPPQSTHNILVAVGEACANAIEHGHHHRPGTVHLRAAATVAELSVTVVDSGQWRPPHAEASVHRGRGIALMRALTHQAVITPGAEGTTVQLQVRIP